MNFSVLVKSFLFKDVSKVAGNHTLYSYNPGKDFTRNRKLGLETLIKLMLTMQKGTIRDELQNFFEYSEDAPTPGALCRQLQKLKPEALSDLMKEFNAHFPCETYKGYRLVGCDGSESNIFRNPKDPDTYHPPSGKSSRGYNLIHMIALFDLLDKRYIDAEFQPYRLKNEYRAICELADRYHCDTKTIFIADRGLGSYNFYAHAENNGLYYLVRAKALNAKRLKGNDDFPEGEFDVTVNRIITRSHKKKLMKHPDRMSDYRVVDKDTDFDFIDPGSSDELHLKIRLLSVRLSTDEYEYLVTNLPEEFGPEDIKTLYHLRWGIETAFRELKHTIGSLFFHSKKYDHIVLELWARMILYNFCSIIASHVTINAKKTKYLHQVNFSAAIKICRHFLGFHGLARPPDAEALISRCTLPIRAGKTFERIKKFKFPMSFLYR
jgi:hypothetical protein